MIMKFACNGVDIGETVHRIMAGALTPPLGEFRMGKGILFESGTNEMELLVFRVGDVEYGINVAKVRELVQMVTTIKVPNAPHAVLGSFRLREEVLTLVSLRRYLGLKDDPDIEGLVIIVEFNTFRCGIHVDSVEMIHRLGWEVIEPPSEYLTSLGTPVTAVARVTDRVVQILDFESIINELFGVGSITLPDTIQAEAVAAVGSVRVLVADDSPIVRQTVEKALQMAGFVDLTICGDGGQAWEAIEAGREARTPPFDLVITDIEMPRMDGLHLTARIKQDPALEAMRVILFSSIISPETQSKGRSVGADAQVAKNDSEGLLKAIHQAVGM
jgi:two-component system, chemotaxis family, chemotaxis protein CheV